MSILTIECCHCKQPMGEKDGGGVEGTTSGLHESCALALLPEHLHGEYLRRRQLEQGC
jgi:hypothetical protein